MNLKRRYQVLLLLLIVITVYYPSLFSPVNTVDDYAMHQGLWDMTQVDLKGLFFPGGNGYYYRPLLYLSFIFDRFVWGLQESFMHLENVLLHAANTVLVFLISDRIFRRYRMNVQVLPFAAALLFALHPINTESVNWISGRTDLLGGLFLLASLLVELIALEKKRTVLAIPAALLFIAGCLAKDTVVFAFPAFILLVFCMDAERESSRAAFVKHLRDNIGFYLLNCLSVAAYFTMRHMAFSKGDGGISLASKSIVGTTTHDTLIKFLIFLKAFGFYCKKLIIPWPLNFAIVRVSNLYAILGVIAMLVCCRLLYRPTVGKVLILFSAAVLSPAFLVPLGNMAWTPFGERYLYMPSATFAVAVTLLVGKMMPPDRGVTGRWLTILAFLLFSGMAYATTERTIVWQDNLTLFQDTLAKSPGFAPARNELGLALQRHGRYREAQEIFASNSLPSTEKYHIISDINMAEVMVSQGDPEGARTLLLSKSFDKTNKFYKTFPSTLIDIDQKIIEHSHSRSLKAKLNDEITSMLKELYDCTKDPFYYYRAGQQYLFMKKHAEAKLYFRLAYENAPKDAYYRDAARKLSLK